MPTYDYQAMDKQGKTIKGVILADSLRDARAQLNHKQLYPISLNEKALSQKQDQSSFWHYRRAIKSKDIALISRQLATMISASTPIEEAVQAIAAQSEKKLIKETLTRVRAELLEGKRLSEALAIDPYSFNDLYRSMVAAGEASGNLGEIMNRIADYAEKSEEVKSKVQSAMIYPIVLTIVACAVLAILMTVVVPKVVAQFNDMGQELPALTQAVMSISGILSQYGLWLVIMLIIIVVAMNYLMRQVKIKRSVHYFYLRLPLIGRLIRSVSSARFARTMGTLIDGGSPVLQSLKAAEETIHNQYLKESVGHIYSDVREGRSLSHAMKRAESFSPLLIYMIAVGEKSGTLADLLMKTADYLEKEFDGFTQTFLSLLEPLIVIIMGVMIGAIVMAIMLPIMRLNSLVIM